MQTSITEREKSNARSGRFTQRIGSTVFDVHVRFDAAKAEPLEDKILRLIKRDLDSGTNRKSEGNGLNYPENNAIMELPQADGLPERGSA